MTRDTPHGTDVERRRLQEAMLDLCAECGYERLTLPALVERAGVATASFHRHYGNLEDCFCELVQEGRDLLLQDVAAHVLREEGWRNQVRAAGYAMLRFLQADERRARLLIVEVLSAGTRAQLIRDQGMQPLFDLIDMGRNELDDPNSISRATAVSVGGAIFKRMHAAIEQGDLSVGDRLVPELMYTVILPYRGPAAALEELSMPPPDRDPAGPIVRARG